MNTNTNANLVVALLATTVLLGFASLAVPFAGEILAGAAVVGALVTMGVLETKKRAC